MHSHSDPVKKESKQCQTQSYNSPTPTSQSLHTSAIITQSDIHVQLVDSATMNTSTKAEVADDRLVYVDLLAPYLASSTAFKLFSSSALTC
jgi:beta-glucanase (GH16 family)